MHYSVAQLLTDNTWNNAFSYAERVAHFGKAQIMIPSLKEIISLEEVQLDNEIVFEEMDHQGEVNSCTGLAHIYKLILPNNANNGSPEIYIFDNHNHALYFRSMYVATLKEWETPKILHIDQHSDLKTPPHFFWWEKIPVEWDEIIDEDFLTKKDNLHNADLRREYTNNVCNVGNFIMPFLKAFPFTSFEWIKAEQQLLDYQANFFSHDKLILDIDLDFWAPEMGIDRYQETIVRTKELIAEASLITIATSPYFLDQPMALGILKDLLT